MPRVKGRGLATSVAVSTFLLAGFGQTEPWVDVAGLVHRPAVMIGWTWTVLLAIQVRRG